MEIVRISTGRETRPLQTFLIDIVGDGFPVPKIPLVNFQFIKFLTQIDRQIMEMPGRSPLPGAIRLLVYHKNGKKYTSFCEAFFTEIPEK